jgi:hypothetical protein
MIIIYPVIKAELASKHEIQHNQMTLDKILFSKYRLYKIRNLFSLKRRVIKYRRNNSNPASPLLRTGAAKNDRQHSAAVVYLILMEICITLFSKLLIEYDIFSNLKLICV